MTSVTNSTGAALWSTGKFAAKSIFPLVYPIKQIYDRGVFNEVVALKQGGKPIQAERVSVKRIAASTLINASVLGTAALTVAKIAFGVAIFSNPIAIAVGAACIALFLIGLAIAYSAHKNDDGLYNSCLSMSERDESLADRLKAMWMSFRSVDEVNFGECAEISTSGSPQSRLSI